MKPKLHVIKKWAAALRSGKYRQGEGAMRVDQKFCCLGVLCDLHRKNCGGRWVHVKDLGGADYAGEPGEESSMTLPTSVANWAGIEFDPIWEGTHFSGLNDSGTSFVEIADIIEKKYLKKQISKS